MELSYDIKTSRDFDLGSDNYSNLELAHMNPSNEKQHVSIFLLENGQMNITIENLDFKEKIKMPHKLKIDKSRQIVKTVIIGNSINFYTRSGKLLKTSTIELPNNSDLVVKLKSISHKLAINKINQSIASLQGQQYIDNLEEFISNAKQHGAQVLSEDNNHMKIRMLMKNLDPRIDKEVEVVIDKRINKMISSSIYDKENKLIQKTSFGYSTGEQHYLNAIRKEHKVNFPTGKIVKKIMLSKIDNFKFKLNV
jgi:hypothetical protein